MKKGGGGPVTGYPGISKWKVGLVGWIMNLLMPGYSAYKTKAISSTGRKKQVAKNENN
jgi:hypothetical protein